MIAKSPFTVYSHALLINMKTCHNDDNDDDDEDITQTILERVFFVST